MEAIELKKRLAKSREAKRRYGRELREAVIAYAAGRKAQGVGRKKVAEELGLSFGTLHAWCTPPRKVTKLTPVSIVPVEPPRPREVTIECGPLRVRGLDLSSVAELLRRLA